MSAFASTSTSAAAASGPSGAEPDEALLSSLSSRLVQSGEWNRLLKMLDLKLNASGWDDQVRVQAQERARTHERPSLQRLVDEITPQARSSVPASVREEVVAALRAWVEKNVEE